MSNEELVNAYAQGRISRRTMIQGLVAAGVSAGAAVSYAHLLAPERARAGSRGFADEYPSTCFDNYPSIDMLILDRKIAAVRREEKLRVKARFARADFEYGTNLEAVDMRLTAVAKKNGILKIMGSKVFRLVDGRTREVTIPLEDISPLRGAERKTVFIRAERSDSDVFCRPNSPRNFIRIKGKLS
ncbi:hypothetical protein HJD18_10585 [Thermoleophilia bacterium SCSIO 60948]|nr:hypothetical protein HJD18_10585 [Thermoleophilia bacterium SCSIO 60948]